MRLLAPLTSTYIQGFPLSDLRPQPSRALEKGRIWGIPAHKIPTGVVGFPIAMQKSSSPVPSQRHKPLKDSGKADSGPFVGNPGVLVVLPGFCSYNPHDRKFLRAAAWLFAKQIPNLPRSELQEPKKQDCHRQLKN